MASWSRLADQIGTGTHSEKSGLDVATISTPVLHVSGSPYAITAVYSGDTIFEGSRSNVASLTINPAPLLITAKNASKVYGAAVPTLTASYSGFVSGDSSASLTTQPTLTTTATAGSHVAGSPYSITASGAVDSDYKISYAAGTMTVTPAALTITAKNASKVYGAAVPTLTASYSGFVNGDSASSLKTQTIVTTTATTGSPVGSYGITASGAVDSDYTINYVAGTLSITTAALKITASNESKVYGQANPTLTVSYSGFVNSDSASSLKTQPIVTTTATTASPVRTYPITASGAVDPNYTISYVAGTLTISKDGTTTSASASAKTSAFGQSVTFTAIVVATPGSGTPSGSVDFFDTTTGDDLGAVSLSGNTASLSTVSLTPGSHVITVSYSGDSNFLASSTTANTITINQSIIVLDPSASGALNVSGNASIKVTGGVYVDSSSSSALSAGGNAQITASVIDVHGGVLKSGNASLSPAPVTKAASVSDPLAGLPVPGTTGLTNYGSENLSGNSKATIKPGIYSQIAVAGNASLTMDAGLYIIEGGGFQVAGNAAVTGAGVTLYNAGSKFPNSGGTFGSINLSGNGTISLSLPTTGSYAGILFLQPAANTQALNFSGNAMAGVTGTIYAPAAQLVGSGNAQLSLTLIVDTMTLSGNAVANIVILTAPSGTVICGLSMPGAGLLQTPESSPLVGTAQSVPTAGTVSAPTIAQAQGASDATFGLTTSESTLSQQSEPAQSFLTVAAPQAQPAPMAPPEAAREHVLGFQANTWENEQNLIVVAHRAGAWPDSVLDELVAALWASRGQEVHRADAVADRPTNMVTVARAGQVEARSAAAYLAPVPAGPMSRLGRPRQAGNPATRLAHLFMVGGFCGLGLAAVQNPRAGRASFRRASISRPNSR